MRKSTGKKKEAKWRVESGEFRVQTADDEGNHKERLCLSTLLDKGWIKDVPEMVMTNKTMGNHHL